jgi:hypothetical protein
MAEKYDRKDGRTQVYEKDKEKGKNGSRMYI